MLWESYGNDMGILWGGFTIALTEVIERTKNKYLKYLRGHRHCKQSHLENTFAQLCKSHVFHAKNINKFIFYRKTLVYFKYLLYLCARF